MFEAEGGDGGAHGVGAVAGAIVGVNALGGDAMLLKEGESGVEEGDGALGGFIGEELGEGQAAVIVDGDVEIFPPGAAGVIVLAVAGDAVAGARDAGELLDVEVEEFAWVGALVALDWRRRGELGEALAVAAQEAGDGGLGELGGAGDLEARELATAQGEHAGDAQWVGGSGGTFGARTAVEETGGPFVPEAGEPLVGAAFRDAEAMSDLGDRLVEIENAPDHLGSTPRGEFGLTVRVHAAVVPGEVLLSQPHLSKSSPHENNLLELHS